MPFAAQNIVDVDVVIFVRVFVFGRGRVDESGAEHAQHHENFEHFGTNTGSETLANFQGKGNIVTLSLVA